MSDNPSSFDPTAFCAFIKSFPSDCGFGDDVERIRGYLLCGHTSAKLMEHHRSTLEAAFDAVRNAGQRMSKSERQCESLAKTNQNLRATNSQLTKDNARIQRRNHELVTKKRASDEELGRVQKKLRSVKEELRGVKDELRGVKEELSGVEEDFLDAKEAEHALRDSANRLRGELDEVSQKSAAQQTTIYQLVHRVVGNA